MDRRGPRRARGAGREAASRSDEVARMADQMEDVEFLRSGHGDYPEESNRKDFFNSYRTLTKYWRRPISFVSFTPASIHV